MGSPVWPLQVEKRKSNKKLDKFNAVPLRAFTPDEKRRLDEISFFILIDQMNKSKVNIDLGVGITIPELLATLTGTPPGLINHAFTVLSQYHNMPTNDEIAVALKRYKVSAAKSMFTPETYYKALKRYVKGGQQELVPVLSQVQHMQVKKFIVNYAKVFLGKRQVSAHLAKGYITR